MFIYKLHSNVFQLLVNNYSPQIEAFLAGIHLNATFHNTEKVQTGKVQLDLLLWLTAPFLPTPLCGWMCVRCSIHTEQHSGVALWCSEIQLNKAAWPWGTEAAPCSCTEGVALYLALCCKYGASWALSELITCEQQVKVGRLISLIL